MAQLMDHVEYLSREIGARPAGTEEEQQAALYIADQFQTEAGFAATIEEFKSTSNLEGGRAILAMITIVVSILAMLFNVLTLPAFILAALAAVVYYLEAYDKPLLSNALARGASQNVVAKYQPVTEASAADKKARTRKVVLVAHYDTGKVTPPLVSRVESLGQPIGAICAGAMIAAAVLLLLRLFVGGSGGFLVILLNILTIVSLVVVAYPVVKAILYRMAPYNEGANNNATGVAALIEAARRISSGSVSEADLAAASADAVIHGEQAARVSGFVPEGAQLDYAVEQNVYDDDPAEGASEEDRLLAAKAAIAALTGRPVEQRVYVSEEELAASRAAAAPQPDSLPETAELPAGSEAEEASAQDGQAEGAAPNAAPDLAAQLPSVPMAGVSLSPAAVPDPAAPAQGGASAEAGGFENAPSWFVAAQRNAKKSASSPETVQRSRYAMAIEAAEREAAAREQARLEEERAARERAQKEREEAARAAMAAQQEQERLARETAQAKAREERERLAAEQERLAKEQQAEGLAEPSASEQGENAPAATAPADPAATLAYTPAQIRKALEEEKAEMERLAAEEAERAEASEGEADADERDDAQGQPAEEVAAPEPEDAIEPEAADIDLPEEGPAAQAPKFDNKGRLIGLPAIDDAPAPVPETTNPSRSGLFRMLRTDVPSLSGIIRLKEDGEGTQDAEPESAGAPQPDQPVDYDMEISLDEAAIPAIELDGDTGAEGVPAADVPAKAEKKPARGGLLGRLRRNDEERLSDSPQEWLDIDGDFDPREVGRERGSWESFRPGQEPEGTGQSGSWQGGAFSRVRLGRVNMLSGEGTHSDEPEQIEESYEDHQLNEEIESIYHFRNPSYETEVWFVAIGSDTELHDGAKAFVAEHRNELRGSTIIEVESLGLGPLAVVAEEGQFRRMQSSSRVKRFTRPATEATGIALDTAKTGYDSVSSTIQKEGFQVIHLTGVEDGKPSLKGSADDVLENVDEMTLMENIDFIMELLKRG